MSQHHLSLALKPLDRHLLTSLHMHSCWHFGNWIIAQAASGCVCGGQGLGRALPTALLLGGHERTVSPVTIPELLRLLRRISCPSLHHFSFSQPRGTCCSCCWGVSRWEAWKLKALRWWSNIWVLWLREMMLSGHPGGPLSSSSSADSDWAVVKAFSCVTAGHEWATVVSPAPYTGVWVFCGCTVSLGFIELKIDIFSMVCAEDRCEVGWCLDTAALVQLQS